MEENKPTHGNSDSNLMAAVSYIWIISIVMLIIKKDDEYVHWHARQAVVLFIISIVASIFFWIPILGWLLWLAVVLLMVWGFIKALSGEKFKLPIIGDLAEKFNI